MLPTTNPTTTAPHTTAAPTMLPAASSSNGSLTSTSVGAQVRVIASTAAALPLSTHAQQELTFADTVDAAVLNSLRGGRSIADAINRVNIQRSTDAIINSVDAYGNTALHQAVLNQDQHGINTLLALPGINPNIINKIDKNTALSLAAEQGLEQIVVQLLLDPRIDLNRGGALANAARENYIRIMELLIDAGANVNAINKFGARALELATANERADAIRLLTSNPKIDINTVNRFGYNALAIAAENGNRQIVEHLLAQPGLNLHTSFPLVMAARNGHLDIIQLLLNASVDPNQTDNDGNTALMEAASYPSADIVSALLKTPGIDCNISNLAGESAIHLAAEVGDGTVIELLLAKDDIDIDAVNNDGDTALQVAAIYGHNEIVALLRDWQQSDP